MAAVSDGCSGTLAVAAPKLWWPYLMDPEPGYLYTLQVKKKSCVMRNTLGRREKLLITCLRKEAPFI